MTNFWEGFFKVAGPATKGVRDLLYRLQRGLPIRIRGHSGKTLRNTRAGKSL